MSFPGNDGGMLGDTSVCDAGDVDDNYLFDDLL